jgi:hypothetical protein
MSSTGMVEPLAFRRRGICRDSGYPIFSKKLARDLCLDIPSG